jgi:hypothetical protein
VCPLLTRSRAAAEVDGPALLAGESIAGLCSLVATCEARQINPFDHIVDVLAPVQDHAASAIAPRKGSIPAHGFSSAHWHGAVVGSHETEQIAPPSAMIPGGRQ